MPSWTGLRQIPTSAGDRVGADRPVTAGRMCHPEPWLRSRKPRHLPDGRSRSRAGASGWIAGPAAGSLVVGVEDAEGESGGGAGDELGLAISSTASFRPVPRAATTFVAAWVVTTSMTTTVLGDRAHVATANIHLCPRLTGTGAYLPPVNAPVRLPGLPDAPRKR
jgi:hypothetical protein